MNKPTNKSKHETKALLLAAGCAALLFMAPLKTAHAEDPPKTATAEAGPQPRIATEEDLARVAAQLEVPATRMAALSQLIQFARDVLYPITGLGFSSGDHKMDALMRKAAGVVDSCEDFETVSQALDSTDPRLQNWGVLTWNRKARRIEDAPAYKGEKTVAIFLPLMPKIKRLAAGADAGVRSYALQGLLWFPENKAFLQERVEAETSAGVLMRILYYGYAPGNTLSERLNPYLLRLLNHADEDVRLRALAFIGNNHNSAEMWHIKFDQPIADKVWEMTKTGPENEKDDALSALDGLKQKPRRDSQR